VWVATGSGLGYTTTAGGIVVITSQIVTGVRCVILYNSSIYISSGQAGWRAINRFGTVGTPPRATGTSNTVLTLTNTLYTSTANPNAFVFDDAAAPPRLWVADSAAGTLGIWRFTFDAGTQLYGAASSSDLVWNTIRATGLTGQYEAGGVFVLYFTAGTVASNAVYRMPVGGSGPYFATTLVTAAANNLYKGISLVPATPLPTPTALRRRRR
jgi:hypothetical protein